ncbi:MAG: ABC transporter ATP-binding protein/permease [Burkholderiales bacterium]|jgi:ATP-binding cassette subfamily B protein|nr:ABC transporter ATP-binding protein/permease [Burkholderiales bacterium]
MTPRHRDTRATVTPAPSISVPAAWQAWALSFLSPDEKILAWVAIDLDARLRFAQELVVVTDRRLLGCALGNNASLEGEPTCREWARRDGQRLSHDDHAGVGTLELLDGNGRLHHWRYTLAQDAAVLRLVQAFGRRQEEPSPESENGAALCPVCGTPLTADDDGCPNCAADGTAPPPSTWILFRLWRFAKPYKGSLLLGFILMLTSTAAGLVAPYLIMPLTDDVLVPAEKGVPVDIGLVALYLGGLLASALLAWGLGWGKTYILALVSERIGADLRTASFEHLMHLSLEYFGGKRTGDLMARISSETDRICLFLSLHLLDFATDVLMITMTAAVLFWINPWLALVTLLPLPFIAWMIHQVRDRLRTGFEKIGRAWSEVTNVLADTIPGIRVVKAFAQEGRETKRFQEANRHNLVANDRVNRLWSLFSPTVSLLTEIGLLVVWMFGIWQVSQSNISTGMLLSALAYIGRFYTRLDSMSRIVSVTQKAAAGAKRIFDILDHVSNVPEPVQPVPLPTVRGQIEMRNVVFRYGNRTVLRGVDLAVAPGEMIGLVGHSGSGKSTLVNLICRFYDAAEGAVLLDGIDIRTLAISDYRRHIGLVLQEPFLFFGTIAENIAYGRPGATREEIVAAARAAHAHEFILRLPHGYDSLVGERGQGLSGGERQRISIARALLIDPKILILDEATSSVDTETEKEIQKALDNLVRGRTTIAIAHRLSTLRKADRLVVMDRGQIVEEGTHDVLIARRGAYFRLYEAQARQVDTEFALAEPWGNTISTTDRSPK